jgi:hypothetical protein
MKRLLVLDFDGTICDSSSMNKWLPEIVNGDHSVWYQKVANARFHPVRGALAGVRKLAKRSDNVIILTGRSELLRASTRKWINKWFPELRGVYISMRQAEDVSATNAQSKSMRLNHFLIADRWDEILVVDDDSAMRNLDGFSNIRVISIDGQWPKKLDATDRCRICSGRCVSPNLHSR